ncbi:MAG TPA: CHAD domain-containing protein [Bryobacteraceae bacterium]|nr:CHAD domain-containing protein [Bryobacteraceae bacterium]
MKQLWNGGRSLTENLRKRLPELTEDFLKHGHLAMRHKKSGRHLHGFRLAVKRYRYTLELFLPVFGPGLQAKLEILRQLQRLMGEINDCVTARKLLKQIPGAKASREALEKRMIRKAAVLRRYWKEQFEPAETTAAWCAYFERYGRVPGKTGGRKQQNLL